VIGVTEGAAPLAQTMCSKTCSWPVRQEAPSTSGVKVSETKPASRLDIVLGPVPKAKEPPKAALSQVV
jgi:hypothetical protein